MESTAQRADGRLFPIELAVTRIVAEGKPMFTGFIRDITDRKRSEEEMRVLMEELKEKTFRSEEASCLKSQFLSNVSHELRTPLNAIIGYMALILEEHYGSLSAPQRAPLASVQRNANDLLSLVNQLLDLDHLELGRFDLDLKTIDLKKVFQEISVEVAPLLKEKGLILHCDFPEEGVPLRSDYQKMKQIFSNLLSNAIKFTHEGEIGIEVKTLPDRQGVEVTIRDTGIGIEAELLPNIFRPFFQGDGSLTRQYGGVGLGLAIVKDFLQLLGGGIRVKSEPGKGSIFIVFLPPETPALERRSI